MEDQNFGVKIVAVSEVFSMQPNTWSINEKRRDGRIVYEIKIEQIRVDDKLYDYLIGSDIHGERIFEFPRQGMNVFYEEIVTPKEGGNQ